MTDTRSRFLPLTAHLADPNRVAGRTKMYELAAEHRGLLRKFGHTTLVDLQVLERILAATPIAKLRLTNRRD
jgi:hypothetical protein